MEIALQGGAKKRGYQPDSEEYGRYRQPGMNTTPLPFARQPGMNTPPIPFARQQGLNTPHPQPRGKPMGMGEEDEEEKRKRELTKLAVRRYMQQPPEGMME